MFGQRSAVGELHGQPKSVGLKLTVGIGGVGRDDAVVVDAHDAGVVEPGDGAHLAVKSLQVGRVIGELGAEYFQRHGATGGSVVAAKDGSHPPLTDGVDDFKGTKHYGEPREGVAGGVRGQPSEP